MRVVPDRGGEPSPSAAAQRMRQLLTDAARAQLHDDGAMTVAAVARRAGVSRATAYRYLINNDAVLLWATRPIAEDLRLGDLPEEAEQQDLPSRAAALVRRAGEWAFDHERELRAVLAASLQPGSANSRQGRMGREQWIETLLADLPENVSTTARDRLAAALTALFGADAVLWTRDAAQLPVPAALDTLAWMAHALVTATLSEAGPDDAG
jgi:AcrR family transcriptional regulator